MEKLILLCALLLGSVAHADETGITKDAILLGQSLPFSGGSAPRATAYHRGSELYFKRINEAGGVHGRKIQLHALDDAYEPQNTVENVKKLISEQKVFALFSVFGTPCVKAILPQVEKEKIPLITPITGARFVRQPVMSDVFVLRASEVEEADKIVTYLKQTKDFKDISLFYQDDALGASGKEALTAALNKFGLKRKSESTYHRNSPVEDKAVEELIGAKPQAVAVWAVAKPAIELIKKSSLKGFKPLFIASSIVDTPEFANEVGALDSETYIAQAVPFLSDPSIPLVAQYLKDSEKIKGKPSTSEFEGYMNAAFFAEAMKQTGATPTRQSLRETIEKMNKFDLAGLKVSFSKDDHQGLSDVAIMKLTKGHFTIVK